MSDVLHAIKYPFAIDAGGGQVAEEGDYEAYIRQLIRQVLMTAPGERINRPDFGAGVRRMVFSPAARTSSIGSMPKSLTGSERRRSRAAADPPYTTP